MSEITIKVPDYNHVIEISEGNGMNLWEEDYENGYVDYIYFEVYENNEEIDGGMILLKKPYLEYSTTEIINKVLDFFYMKNADFYGSDGNEFYEVIEKGDDE